MEELAKKATVVIRLALPSERAASIVQNALKPETKSSPGGRSEVQVAREGRVLALIFECRDTTALRASVNSYLSWLQLLDDINNLLRTQQP